MTLGKSSANSEEHFYEMEIDSVPDPSQLANMEEISLGNIPWNPQDDMSKENKQNQVIVLPGGRIATKGSEITYHDLSYTVKIKIKQKCSCGTVDKTILNNLNGIFKPGMNAIMGPTGGGKSSLLDVLAGRKNPAGVSGTVMVDGKRQPINFNRMAGYVVQEDIVMGTLSVRENIMFSANLRLARSLGHEEKKNRVSEVIKELGLTKCADTKVGTEFIRGVSGGEKKRTCIGMEMIVSPNILFLDEPTTGLDSNTAVAVMSLLHKLSLKGRTIIFSIHQPRYSIFKLFHRLTLLADGRTVYHGPAEEALEHFASLGYTCEVHNNPPDFFLDVIKEAYSRNEGVDSEESDLSVVVSDAVTASQPEVPFSMFLNKKYLESSWALNVQDELRSYPVPKKENFIRNFFHDPYPTSFITQFKYLLARSFKNLVRNPQAVMSQIIASTILAIIIGLIFLRLDLKIDLASVAIQNRAGALFFITVNQMFANMSAVELFVRERVIFKHENGSGYYRTVSYFFSKVMCDIITMRLIPITVFAIITYFMIGFHYTAGKFFIFYSGLILTSLSASCISFAIGASVQTIPIGTLILTFLYVLMMLFGGFLSNIKSMGDWLNWLSYFSIIKYSITIQYVNQLAESPIYVLNETTGREYLDENIGNAYLNNLGFSYGTSFDIGKNYLALICISIILLGITYIKLRNIPKYK